MSRQMALNELPDDLPIPEDDGACDHLPGMELPEVSLRSTAGRDVNLAGLPGRTVIYCYPRTGQPDRELPTGWDQIPGARGCTPQSCSFRDYYQELQSVGTDVFGLSTQDTGYQQEAVDRLHLPFELLSDEELAFATALRLPTFDVDSHTLIKRLTLIVFDSLIQTVFYPVFPPNEDAERVLVWLRANPMLPDGINA